jgi:hypothetical protein
LLGLIRRVEVLQNKNDQTERAGRFFHGGISETATHLSSIGWKVISADIGLNLRDPIVYFEKPRP